MRLSHASALFILINACASKDGERATDAGTQTAEENTTAESSVAATASNDNTTKPVVAPNGGTSESEPSPTSTNGTSTNVSTGVTNTTITSTSSRPDATSTDGTTSNQGTSDSDDADSDETDADDGTDSDETDTTESDSGGDSDDADSSGDTTNAEVIDTGADDKFSFFVTSYHHLVELSGSVDGFGGDLRYKGAATGLEGADAICQEIAARVGFGHKTWRAYLSTSTVNAIDRIGNGPWYDFVGALVADSATHLLSGANRQPGGCCETGTYDELGLFHDGTTDQNNDGIDDDDHDTMTATLEDGTYAGFSCDDWTSTVATSSGTTQGEQVQPGGGAQGGGGFQGGGGGPGGGSGIRMGHSWPARSGEHWATSHGGHQCAAGTNFIQNGGGDSSTVGGGGGYGGFYCFSLSE